MTCIISLISCARGRLISVPKRVDKCINENKITKKGELWNHSEELYRHQAAINRYRNLRRHHVVMVSCHFRLREEIA